jgi:hypothetical protein
MSGVALDVSVGSIKNRSFGRLFGADFFNRAFSDLPSGAGCDEYRAR